MDWQQMVETFASLSASQRLAWWRMGAGVLVLMAVLLALEGWYFQRQQRLGSWAVLRMASLPLAVIALATLFGPARAVPGPAALGVFLVALYTVAPLVWFGGHQVIGRWVRPGLTRAQSLALGVSGLAVLAVPGAAALQMEHLLLADAREIAQRGDLPSDNPPLEHAVGPVQRFNMPGVGLVYAQSLRGAPDTRLVRVVLRRGGLWDRDASMAHPSVCTHGNDVHLLWSAQEPIPYLRLHWAQSNAAMQHAEFTPQIEGDAQQPILEFSVGIRSDGVDPVVPVARERVYLVMTQPGVPQTYTEMLGASRHDSEQGGTDCVMLGYQRPPTLKAWQVQAMGVLFSPLGTSHRAVFERPHPVRRVE